MNELFEYVETLRRSIDGLETNNGDSQWTKRTLNELHAISLKRARLEFLCISNVQQEWFKSSIDDLMQSLKSQDISPQLNTIVDNYYDYGERCNNIKQIKTLCWGLLHDIKQIYAPFIRTNGKQNSSNRNDYGNPNSNEHNYPIKNKEAVLYIYNSLEGDAFELTETQFCTLVENADFSSVYGKKQKNKAKIKYMISCLSVCMSSVWYGNAAKSIGVKPQGCSGANVSEYIKNKLNKDKIEKIIKREQ
ncbi:hypothetical protein [Bacteroides eggerthii]|uniref:hypothetical protein n=1 Tax=Bacteroides eggerthii TaxID=28111 RepID=UPI00189F3CBC|nr:hypothetical protein [Bacteroides eggerthii]